MKEKITINNIFSYLEGNVQMILEEFNFQPQHIKEQIAYRRLLCKDDCGIDNMCIYCGCNAKGKSSVKKSCNKGKRFPDLMNKNQWTTYKIENEIE